MHICESLSFELPFWFYGRDDFCAPSILELSLYLRAGMFTIASRWVLFGLLFLDNLHKCLYIIVHVCV